jgi:membrane protein YdbS with pleckstrin-like domain
MALWLYLEAAVLIIIACFINIGKIMNSSDMKWVVLYLVVASLFIFGIFWFDSDRPKFVKMDGREYLMYKDELYIKANQMAVYNKNSGDKE